MVGLSRYDSDLLLGLKPCALFYAVSALRLTPFESRGTRLRLSLDIYNPSKPPFDKGGLWQADGLQATPIYFWLLVFSY